MCCLPGYRDVLKVVCPGFKGSITVNTLLMIDDIDIGAFGQNIVISDFCCQVLVFLKHFCG